MGDNHSTIRRAYNYNANVTMEEQWSVIFYKTLQGDTPVNDFISSLELKAQSKVRDSIKLLTSAWVQKEKK